MALPKGEGTMAHDRHEPDKGTETWRCLRVTLRSACSHDRHEPDKGTETQHAGDKRGPDEALTTDMSPIRALKLARKTLLHEADIISHDRHEPDKGTETAVSRATDAPVMLNSRQT